jgi:hypothetical protein
VPSSARAEHALTIARQLAAPLLLAIAACGTPSYPAPTADCKTEHDCALDDVSRDCCGDLCGPSPPWVAIDIKSRKAITEEVRARCEGKRLDCPVASCVAPAACRATPKAVCQAGRCVARVELTEACGPGSCAASCGAQPAAAPPGKEGACAAALESEWVRCCCQAMGSPATVCEPSGAPPVIPEECRAPGAQ